MAASKSTASSNGSREEQEEEPQQENNRWYGGSSTAAVLTAAVAAGGALAWGISRVLSNNTDTQQRNRHVTGPSLVNSSYMIYESNTETEESNHQGTKPSLLNTARTVYETYKQRSIWSPPPPGCFKLNTDGACHPMRQDGVQRGPSGYGGILRDHHGNFVRGFIGFIGDSDCLTTELHGILKGLELLDQLNIEQAILETDSQAAYEFVTGHDEYRRQKPIVTASWSIIQKCRQLAEKNGTRFELVPGRDANQCADKLADMAIMRRAAYLEFKDVPNELKYLVEKDAKVYC